MNTWSIESPSWLWHQHEMMINVDNLFIIFNRNLCCPWSLIFRDKQQKSDNNRIPRNICDIWGGNGWWEDTLKGSLDDIVAKCLRVKQRHKESELRKSLQFKLNVMIVNELLVCFKDRFKRIHRTNSLIKAVATEGIPWLPNEWPWLLILL